MVLEEEERDKKLAEKKCYSNNSKEVDRICLKWMISLPKEMKKME